jgi:hydrogenase large subunit
VPEFYRTVQVPVGISHGYGLVEAPRGALGHFITASAGKIVSYQCVVPTTWNASPKDATALPVVAPNVKAGTHRGAMEQAMIGVEFDASLKIPADVPSGRREALSGVEVLRVAQSFDPCIACAVH